MLIWIMAWSIIHYKYRIIKWLSGSIYNILFLFQVHIPYEKIITNHHILLHHVRHPTSESFPDIFHICYIPSSIGCRIRIYAFVLNKKFSYFWEELVCLIFFTGTQPSPPFLDSFYIFISFCIISLPNMIYIIFKGYIVWLIEC